MVVYVTQRQAVLHPMHDHSDVAADADRPEIRVSCLAKFVELQPRLSRIQLEVEGGDLHSLLLVTGQLGEAVGEGVGNADVHYCTCS